jgi:integrase
MLLIDLFESYRAERPNLQFLSAREILYTIRAFNRFLVRPASLGDLSKQNLLGIMAVSRAASTANKHRVNLLGLWRHAAERGLIAPPPKILKRTEPIREPVAWNLAEMQQLFAAAKLLEGNWDGVPIRLAWKLGIAILWDTACRIKTLLLADMNELRLTDGTWHVPAEHMKGRRADKIYQLHPDTCLLISRSLFKPRKKLWPYPYTENCAIKHFGKLLKLAGLPSDRHHKFHCIRRTAESYAAANMGIEAAAAAVGHSVAVAKKHYISPAICKPPALIDGLPRIF